MYSRKARRPRHDKESLILPMQSFLFKGPKLSVRHEPSGYYPFFLYASRCSHLQVLSVFICLSTQRHASTCQEYSCARCSWESENPWECWALWPIPGIPAFTRMTGRWWVQGQPGLYRKFKSSLGYSVRLCLKTEVTKQNPASQTIYLPSGVWKPYARPLNLGLSFGKEAKSIFLKILGENHWALNNIQSITHTQGMVNIITMAIG